MPYSLTHIPEVTRGLGRAMAASTAVWDIETGHINGDAPSLLARKEVLLAQRS
jgi:hypothetical protein